MQVLIDANVILDMVFKRSGCDNFHETIQTDKGNWSQCIYNRLFRDGYFLYHP